MEPIASAISKVFIESDPLLCNLFLDITTMDNLLAGYGSDSEESSSSAVNNALESTDKQDTKVAPISSLLGAGIDSCSSSSDDDEVSKQNHGPSHPSRLSSKNALDTDTHTKKKQRLDQTNASKEINHEKSDTFLKRNGLPPPRLASDTPLEAASMISWTTDYISRESPSPTVANSKEDRQFRKFEELAGSQLYNAKTGWAAHLRNQHEFHNPHSIQSAIEHFGIKESLGSQAVRMTKARQRRFH